MTNTELSPASYEGISEWLWLSMVADHHQFWADIEKEQGFPLDEDQEWCLRENGPDGQDVQVALEELGYIHIPQPPSGLRAKRRPMAFPLNTEG